MSFPNEHVERFLDNFEVGGDDECWEWLGSKDGKGYGRFGFCGKRQSAHRLSYSYFNGKIPNGLHVLHYCDNSICVNPNHLRVGTHQDNMNDKKDRGRSPKGVKHYMFGKTHSSGTRKKMSENHDDRSGEKHHLSKLTDEKVLQMKRIRKEKGYSYEIIGKMFGVSRRTASDAICGTTWKHLKQTRMS